MEENSRARSKSSRTLFGSILILIVGLLNFHIPHFFFEANDLSGASRVLEIVFVINLLGALCAAVGIYRAERWGWILGIVVAVASILLYVVQETVGLPGLPQMWLEPSRIVAVIVEVIFVVMAYPGVSDKM